MFHVDVFERDSRERDQGAGWDINQDAQRTFARAGLDWRTIVREGSDTWRIFRVGDEAGLPKLVVTPPEIVKWWTGEGQPESNRHAMREGLLAAMGRGVTVHFDRAVGGMEVDADGTARLHGKGGDALGTFDLVVDSSGVGSPLRKHRVVEDGTNQYYIGLTMVNGIVQDPEASLDPRLVRMLGQGTVEIVGDRADGEGGFMIMMQRYGHSPSDRRAKLQTFFVRERRNQLAEELSLGRIPYSHISKTEHPEAFGRVTRLLKAHMGARWPRMYHDAVDALEPVQVWDLHQFPHSARLVADGALPLLLLGDALHCMSPTSGSGGNLAVKDADDAATYLIEAHGHGRERLLSELTPLMQRLLDRMRPREERGKVQAQRFRDVLQSKRPVSEYYTKEYLLGTVYPRFHPRRGMEMRAMDWIHRLEGYGMGL